MVMLAREWLNATVSWNVVLYLEIRPQCPSRVSLSFIFQLMVNWEEVK